MGMYLIFKESIVKRVRARAKYHPVIYDQEIYMIDFEKIDGGTLQSYDRKEQFV